MAELKTTALILRKIPYGESDAVVTCLTEKGMRLSGFAKGEAQSRKRFGGALDFFNVVHLVGNSDKEGMVLFSSAELAEGMFSIREDLSKFAAACYFSELVLSFVHDHETLSSLYDVFHSFLTSLNQSSLFQPHLVPLMEHRLLHLFGYKPELSSCVTCQESLDPEQKYFFNGPKGGIICRSCVPTQNEYPLTYQALRQMLTSFETPPSQWGGLEWKADDVRQARNAFEYFIQYTAGKPFKSLTFLSRILA